MTGKYFKLAIRNIVLYRRRSFLTGTVMVFSTISLIVAASMGEAFYRQLVNVGIKTATGHLQIIPEESDFDMMNPMAGDIPVISESNIVEEIITKVPYYKAHSREILYQMLLYDKHDNFFQGTIIGLEPEKAIKTLPGLKVAEGSTLEKSLNEGILISPIMKTYFDMKEKDEMYIITGGPLGLMNGVKTNFTGVVEYMPFLAGRIAYIDIAKARELLGFEDSICTTIKVVLKDRKKSEMAARWLSSEFRRRGLKLKVMDWRQLGGFYYHIALIGRFLVFVLLLILSTITGLSVLNTMLMSIKERTKEIGTILAMGMHERHVLKLFVFESFTLSVTSSLVGLLLGVGLTKWFEKNGILHGLALVLEKQLIPTPELAVVFLSFLWIVISGTLGGYLPARKASKLDPVVALRYV